MRRWSNVSVLFLQRPNTTSFLPHFFFFFFSCCLALIESSETRTTSWYWRSSFCLASICFIYFSHWVCCAGVHWRGPPAWPKQYRLRIDTSDWLSLQVFFAFIYWLSKCKEKGPPCVGKSNRPAGHVNESLSTNATDVIVYSSDASARPLNLIEMRHNS